MVNLVKALQLYSWYNYRVINYASRAFIRLKTGMPITRRKVEVGSSCGSVGRAVASDTRGPQFESSHQQNLHYLYAVNSIEKTKIKKIAAEYGPFKKVLGVSFLILTAFM